MSNCPTFTYANITANKFQALRQECQKYGIQVPSTPSGQVVANVVGLSFKFDYNLNSASNTLVLTCTQKPFFLPCNTVKSYIDNAIAHLNANSFQANVNVLQEASALNFVATTAVAPIFADVQTDAVQPNIVFLPEQFTYQLGQFKVEVAQLYVPNLVCVKAQLGDKPVSQFVLNAAIPSQPLQGNHGADNVEAKVTFNPESQFVQLEGTLFQDNLIRPFNKTFSV